LHARRALPGLAALAALLAPASARAVEHEHHLGVGLGGAALKVDDKGGMMVGGAAAAHYAYGFTDAFNFVAEYSSAIVALDAKLDTPTTPHTRPGTIDTLGIGAAYVFDVLRWVPYASIMASGSLLHGGTIDGSLLTGGAQLGLGVDYKFSFSWAAGVAYRQHLFLTKMSTYPSYSQVFLRIEYAWGR
jgi:opacity protein-like surface antigen